MKNKYKYLISLMFCVIFFSCSSSDDENCTKIITIPQVYFVNNQSFTIDREQEVSCDTPEPTEPEVLTQPPVLEGFTYEVLKFEFTPNTGNNTLRLQFEIKLNNNSDNSVKGVPYLTIKTDQLEFSNSYSNISQSPCLQIEANSSCIHTLDIEESLDIATQTAMELLDVEYFITN
ncbi:hypothetical protein [uncultured Aquimarina sp.]|uniref:hypothetical protein n=1 Tax=uncultured Aquimarina sp. TaxID=575652 RepID=UPI0026102270|nr:hypothetical protein [uncultured Aquimarina sp.]